MWVTTNADGQFTTADIHSSFGTIAAASIDGIVSIFEEDLQPIQTLPAKKDTTISQIKWHPAKKMLVIAWKSGAVALWCMDTEGNIREGLVHTAPISCLKWSSSGNHLITGDEEGTVVVWKVDNRGKLSTLTQYRLRDAITHISFKTIGRVSKDGRTPKDKDCPPFFIADKAGTIFFADDSGHCSESLTTQSPVNLMFYHEARDLLLLLTEDLLFSHYLLNQDGKLILDTAWPQIKLGGSIQTGAKPSIKSLWLDSDVLVYSVNSGPPKVWDSESEETFILDKPDSFGQNATTTSLAFSKKNDLLAVSTDSGHVVLWSRSNGANGSWEPLQKIELTGNALEMKWGISDSSLMLLKANGFQLIYEQIVHVSGYGSAIFVSQIGAKKLLIENDSGKIHSLYTEGKIKSLSISSGSLAIWTGSNLELYTLEGIDPKFHSSIACTSPLFAVNQNFVCLVNSNRSNASIFNMTTNTTSTISLPDSDGEISAINFSGSKFSLFTSERVIKTYEIVKRDYRLVLNRKIDSNFEAKDGVQFKSNSDGSFFAILSPSDLTTLFVYSSENAQLYSHDCGTKIKSFTWDEKDCRVLAAQIGTSQENSAKGAPNQIMSFFASDNQLVFKDMQTSPPNADLLVTISLPFHYYYKKMEFKADLSAKFFPNLIKEYSGIDTKDDALVKTITDFSIKLSMGQLDDAAKVVKLIKNEAVWENMSHVCIKMRRTKLAKLCMGKLKNAKALRSIAALSLKDDNALAAQFALHLGLYEEAKEMWSETSNFSQLISFHQSSGDWMKAIDVAANHDRPSLTTAYFKFAKAAEDSDKSSAIAAYEKSNASKAQILRMMLSDNEELKRYVDASSDNETKKWWAQNAESHGDVQNAMKYYNDAGDFFSVIRVHCRSGDIKKAVEIAELHPENLVGAFYIGKEFEKQKDWSSAITFYSRAKCFSSAIRIAKENNISKELLQLALQSSPNHMADVAKHFEQNGDIEKAITLYCKAGNIQKSLGLCFKSKNIKMLESIVSQINPSTDEDVLNSASIFLAQHGSHQTALKLLISARKYHEALQICEKENVEMTEDLYETFNIPSNLPEAKEIHQRLGELSLKQNYFQLACKSFTLAGDRLKAMGALLKSGEKDKIITFANVSKNTEIYTIAANFLQSLNWINDLVVMRTIIQFYTKAKAFNSLGRFYESCAQIEIDEFQNYEKALGALKEAEICLERDNSEISTQVIKKKKEAISMFLTAIDEAKLNNVEKCEGICADLLSFDEIDEAVRIGDILGLLIETNYKAGQIDKAKELFKRLKMRIANINPQYYVDDNICKELDTVAYSNYLEEHIEENI